MHFQAIWGRARSLTPDAEWQHGGGCQLAGVAAGKGAAWARYRLSSQQLSSSPPGAPWCPAPLAGAASPRLLLPRPTSPCTTRMPPPPQYTRSPPRKPAAHLKHHQTRYPLPSTSRSHPTLSTSLTPSPPPPLTSRPIRQPPAVAKALPRQPPPLPRQPLPHPRPPPLYSPRGCRQRGGGRRRRRRGGAWRRRWPAALWPDQTIRAFH